MVKLSSSATNLQQLPRMFLLLNGFNRKNPINYIFQDAFSLRNVQSESQEITQDKGSINGRTPTVWTSVSWLQRHKGSFQPGPYGVPEIPSGGLWPGYSPVDRTPSPPGRV